MTFPFFKIRIHHVFILSLVLLVLDAAISATYSQYFIEKNSKEVAAHLVYDAFQTRMNLLRDPAQMATVDRQTTELEGGVEAHPDLRILLQKTPPQSGLELSSTILIPDPSLTKRMIQQLFNEHQLSIVTPLNNNSQWLTLTVSYSTITVWQRSALYLFFHLLTICILWLAFFVYCRYALPQEVLSGVLNKRSEQKSSDRVIQQLQHQIQSYVDEKNLMLSALAHDIKTPLTEALLRLELLQDPETTDAIRNNLDKINRIVTTSLDYAKQPGLIKTLQVDLVSLIESMIDQYSSNDFDIRFHSEVEQFDAPVELELFRRMISNLLENAKKYATFCSIELRLINAHQFELSFEDNGPGVPNQFLHLLGIPYFRVDQARGSNTGGTGLGLAIVKKVVELHQGEATFRNIEGGGFKATLRFDVHKLSPIA